MKSLFVNVPNYAESSLESEHDFNGILSKAITLAVVDRRVAGLTSALESFDEEIPDLTYSVVDFSIESFMELVNEDELDELVQSLEEDEASDSETKKESRLDSLKKVGENINNKKKELFAWLSKKINKFVDWIKTFFKDTEEQIATLRETKDESHDLGEQSVIFSSKISGLSHKKAFTVKVGGKEFTYEETGDKKATSESTEMDKKNFTVKSMLDHIEDANGEIKAAKSKLDSLDKDNPEEVVDVVRFTSTFTDILKLLKKDIKAKLSIVRGAPKKSAE